MKRLEASGAVRPLYGSLGVKGLIGFIWTQHENISNVADIFVSNNNNNVARAFPRVQCGHCGQINTSVLISFLINPKYADTSPSDNPAADTFSIIKMNVCVFIRLNLREVFPSVSLTK